MNLCDEAKPVLADTGTLFIEVPLCTNCEQPIRLVGKIPYNTEKAARTWVHVHNSSTYCCGRGD